jgi:hypothetical protein
MQALAAFLVSALGGFVGWLAKRLTFKYAVITAYIAGYFALLLAFFVGLKVVASGLFMVAPSDYLKIGFYIFWPDNAPFIFSAIISVDVAQFIYRLHAYQMRVMLDSIARIGA